MLARGDGALYWPARRALLVADLHLEKASWLARGGQMLPPFDTRATLQRLLDAVEECDACELWALGDSFHDAAAPERLHPQDYALIETLAAHVDLHWVEGNHDSGATEHHLPGTWHDSVRLAPFTLRHISEPDNDDGPELSGHYHPKIRIATRGSSQWRACFLLGANQRMILPAYGALTGGMDCTDPALQPFGPQQALIAGRRGLQGFAVKSTVNCGSKAALVTK